MKMLLMLTVLLCALGQTLGKIREGRRTIRSSAVTVTSLNPGDEAGENESFTHNKYEEPPKYEPNDYNYYEHKDYNHTTTTATATSATTGTARPFLPTDTASPTTTSATPTTTAGFPTHVYHYVNLKWLILTLDIQRKRCHNTKA